MGQIRLGALMSAQPMTQPIPKLVKVLFLITYIKMVSKPSSSAFEGVKMLKWNCLPGRIKKSWHGRIVVVVGLNGLGKV